MAFTSGTSAIKLQNIDTITLVEGLNTVAISGDNILDGVVITPSVGTTTRMASGRDRVSSEKVMIEFTVVEETSANITKVLGMKNKTTAVTVEFDADVDGLNVQMTGVLQILRTVPTNGNIGYKVSMEINAKDIDTELTRA